MLDTSQERQTFKNDNAALIAHAKTIEGKLNGAMGLKAMMTSSAEAKIVRDFFTKRMREHLYRDDILSSYSRHSLLVAVD